ncbi:response regulator transcription factor [Lacisediminimonas profundi]|uniref:response regulator transcription factor n=1 Tax=Lacisediminimonas profundi TaxID=2603856 RepID=UPI00124B9B51|nr:helix-turn-helix transcriptional regulator [Lacisediminimonas profundi]
MQALSETILLLYRAARMVPANQFAEAVLAILHEQVRFDRGLLVVHDADTVFPSGGLQPKHGRAAVLDREQLHKLAPSCVGLCDRLEREDRHRELFMHVAEAAPAHLLFACDEEIQPAPWLVLLRQPPATFSVGDQAFFSAFWPHVLQAFNFNLRHVLDLNDQRRAGRALALINAFGVIETADPGMLDLLAHEWPGHSGQRLSREALMALVETGRYCGKRIAISMSRNCGYMVCTGRRLSVVHLLARSELAVAYNFASGMSHKEIAIRLGVSPHTVRNQLVAVYQKLDIHSKAELASMLAEEERRRKEHGKGQPEIGGRRIGDPGRDASSVRNLKRSGAKSVSSSAIASFTAGQRGSTLESLGR